jgi:hypothetical protein
MTPALTASLKAGTRQIPMLCFLNLNIDSAVQRWGMDGDWDF